MARRTWGYAAAAALVVAAVSGVTALKCGDNSSPERDRVGPLPTGSARDRVAPTLVPARASPVLDVAPGRLRLEGTVVDDGDHRIGGATIRLLPGDRLATSAADGSFAFDQLTAGHYTVSAGKDELYSHRTPVQLDATSEPVTLRVLRGMTLVVHVVGEHGPLAGAHVVVAADVATPAPTGADGTTRVRGLWPTWFQLAVTAPGYATHREDIVVLEDPGNAQDLTVTLRPGAPLSGTVVAPDGSLVAGAAVEIEPLTEHGATQTTADDHGAWRVDALVPGRYCVSAKSDVYGPTVAAPIAIDDMRPKTGIVVRVATGGEIAGTVVDTTGAPLRDVDVTVQQTTRVDQFRGKSDAHGAFAIRGLPVGTYYVMRTAGDRFAPVQPLDLAEGQHAQLRIVVDDEHIAGTVVDPAGAAVAGAFVSARDSYAADVSDARGRFRLVLAAGGAHQLFVSRRSDDSGTRVDPDAVVTGNATDVKLVLPPPPTLVGRVLFEGAPVASYGVRLTALGWSRDTPFVVRAADGRFTRGDLHPGTWCVAVTADGMDITSVDNVQIEAGKRTDVGDLVLVRGRRLVGHVRDATGSPVSGARVVYGYEAPSKPPLEARFDGNYVTTTDASGAFAFDAIARQAGPLIARHPQLGVSTRVDVAPADTSIDLTLAPTGGIDGAIDNFRGDQTYINARAAGQDYNRDALIDRAGEFHFDDLPPTTYQVSGTEIPSTMVTVTAGHRTSIRVRLEAPGITLLVTVDPASCTGLFLVAADGASLTPSCSGGTATFAAIQPGAYRACDRTRSCVPVLVDERLPTQHIDVRSPAP